jgi:penicillin-binding protein-related factor A (putative recombinase)
MAVYRSRPVLLECKTTRNLTSFPLYYGATRSIPSHQIKLARQAQQHGALAFILIRRDEPRNKRVFAITPEQADYLYKKKDGKSINWKWFHANAFELKRLKTPLRWELIPLLEEHL